MFIGLLEINSLDSLGLLALQTVFVLGALTPVVIVLIYRRLRVRARCAEITEIMRAAFGPENGARSAEQLQARKALDDNPYISALDKSFKVCHSWKHYAFPLASLLVLSVSISTFLYTWCRIRLSPPWTGGPVSTVIPTLAMALAGGYVWALYQLVSRVGSDELGPSDLGEINLGLLACVPIGYAFSFLALGDFAPLGAFVAASFPVRDAQRLLQEQALKRAFGADVATRAPRPTERNLGTAIDGISDQTLVRLAELRIVTVLDMAYSDPIKIMLQTGYALPLVIDWMDQSVWALYAGDARTALISCGIRCSLDVYEFVDLHGLWDVAANRRGVPNGADLEALKTVANKLGTTSELTQDLFLRIYGDPQVVVLRRLWYVNGAPPSVRAATPAPEPIQGVPPVARAAAVAPAAQASIAQDPVLAAPASGTSLAPLIPPPPAEGSRPRP